MATVTKSRCHPSIPVGEMRVIRGTVTEDVEAGDLLVLGPTGWARFDDDNPARKLGFAAQGYRAGDADCSIFSHGQMAGWVGLEPGQPLWPSTEVAGALDDEPYTIEVEVDSETGDVPITARIHAISATQVEFTL